MGRKPEELVMLTSGDFRERSEAYDVLQMAIPAKEKQVGDGGSSSSSSSSSSSATVE